MPDSSDFNGKASSDDGPHQFACGSAVDLKVAAYLRSKEAAAVETDQGDPLGFPCCPAKLGQILLAALEMGETHNGWITLTRDGAESLIDLQVNDDKAHRIGHDKSRWNLFEKGEL